MNALELRRRTLGKGVYKKTVEGNPAIAQGSLSRRYPGIEMQGWTEQAQYKGNQLFDASKLQTRSVGGAAVTNNGDGSFTVSGSGNLSSVFSYYYDYSHEETIELLQSGEKIKVNQRPTVVPTIVMQLIQSETTQQTVSTGGYTITEDDIQNPDFHIRLLMYGNSGAEIVPGTYKPMVYQDGDGTWEPYTGGAPSPSPDYPQEIVSAGNWNEETQKYEYGVKLTGAQLFDISKVITEEGVVINNGDGTLTVKTSVGSNGVAAKFPHRLRDYCPDIVPGKTYYLYADSTGSEKFIYFSKSKFVWDFGSGRAITDDDLDSIVFFYASGLSTEATVSNIMITEVSNAPHEPYKPPQTVILTADRPLTKWDKLEKRNGQWGWAYKSAEAVFDGGEEWSQYSGGNVVAVFLIVLPNTPLEFQTSLCDKYRNINYAWDVNYDGVFGIYSDNAVFTAKYFRPPSAAVETVEQWKAWLSENPLTLWHETEAETFIPLTASEQEQMNSLYTYRPTTVLSNNQNCDMSLTYKTRKSMEVTT